MRLSWIHLKVDVQSNPLFKLQRKLRRRLHAAQKVQMIAKLEAMYPVYDDELARRQVTRQVAQAV